MDQDKKFKNISVIGICGREGSGKTTIAEYLCDKKKNSTLIKINHIMFYVLETLFGWDYYDLLYGKHDNFINIKPDEIWGLTVPEAIQKVNDLFKKHIDSKFQLLNYSFVPLEQKEYIKKAYEYAFADPLKKIASVIFDFPDISQFDLYKILQGNTKEGREIREKIETVNYDICGKISGRRCLEYLGTEVFRDNFDKEIWIKIFHREVKKISLEKEKYIKSLQKVEIDPTLFANPCMSMVELFNAYNDTTLVVISDLRFDNEFDAVEKINGNIIVVFKNENDLILTEEDQKKHPTKWTFLKCISKVKNLNKICNEGSFEELYTKVNKIISGKN